MKKKQKTSKKKPKVQEEKAEISEYFFTFELLKQYPTVRSFIIKAPLKRSFRDSFSELLSGGKKGSAKP